MVIDKILKVNSNDPKADELRARLAALQQKMSAAPTGPPPRMGPTQPPSGNSAPAASASQGSATTRAPVSAMDADLQKMGFAEQKRTLESREPEIKLKEERTLNLVMAQIGEIINLQNDNARKTKDLETKNAQLEKSLETFKDKHEELLQKMNGIDSRLEKFMGLYEIVTAQYNPFTAAHGAMPVAAQRPSGVAKQATPSFTQTLAEQLDAQRAKSTAPPVAAGEFAVEDSLTNERTVVTVKPEDAMAADARFKRVEELLADLHEKHTADAETPNGKNNTGQAPQVVTQELHTFLTGFEERLTKQLDSSLQQKLHERFSALEGNLQNEIRDALHDEIESVQKDEAELQQALVELQSLVQSKEGPTRDALEDELASMQRQLTAVRDDIKAISPELYFRLADGRVLKDLAGLRDALKTMSPQVFAHHVRADGNDFASWVEHALASPALAELMREQKTPQDMVAAIIAHDGMDD